MVYIYEEIRGSDWFDFSNYPKDHPNYDNSNNKVPGKFKDEMGGQPIVECVGHRSKMYRVSQKMGINLSQAQSY